MICFKIKQANITIYPIILIIFVIMYAVGYLYEFSVIYISIFLHELGHIIAAALLGGKVCTLRFLPIGFNVMTDESECGKNERSIIYFSGPFVNIILSGIGIILNSYYLFQSDNMRFFISSNIYLAVFNLLPVIPLDGGKILREFLIERAGLFSARRYIRYITVLITSFITILGIFQAYNNPYNISLFVIGIYIFMSLKYHNSEAAIMNVKNVIYRRSRLLKKGIYPARDIVVIQSLRLSEVIKSMDFDRFHFVHVLDEELRLLKTFTEQEVIDQILKSNNDMTFEELIKLTS